jgi:3-hydroxyisobutyrate dehydrogenase-like beta-hydroxyacid dehydrogenase
MEKAGAGFVDGSIIGKAGPDPRSKRLYLSGKAAEEAAACFSAGPFKACVIGDSIGKASALKMCTSAYSKGTRALLGAILALADGHDVRTELQHHWSLSSSDFVEKTSESVKKTTAKAWRFVGEMQEISETFAAAGLPGDFHHAAAVIYRKMSHFKNASATVSIEEILEALLQSKD